MGKLARADVDVGDRIHHIRPGHSAHVSVGAVALLIDDAADSHQPTVFCVHAALLERRAKCLFVHVAFVDHHGEDQRWRNSVPLR